MPATVILRSKCKLRVCRFVLWNILKLHLNSRTSARTCYAVNNYKSRVDSKTGRRRCFPRLSRCTGWCSINAVNVTFKTYTYIFYADFSFAKVALIIAIKRRHAGRALRFVRCTMWMAIKSVAATNNGRLNSNS